MLQFDKDITLHGHSSFWDLGFDSITSTRLIQNLEKYMGQNLVSTILLQYPTIDSLVRFLSKVKNGNQLKNFIETSDCDVIDIRTRLTSALHRLLLLEPGVEIDQQTPIWDLGLDSFGSIELIHTLGKELNLSIDYALLLSYPTIEELSNHLVEMLRTNDCGSSESSKDELIEEGSKMKLN